MSEQESDEQWSAQESHERWNQVASFIERQVRLSYLI
jgi:hypothetical protein